MGKKEEENKLAVVQNGNKTDNNKKEDQERTIRNKESLLKALEQTLGIVHPACKMANLNRSTYYDYMSDDPEFKKKVLDIMEGTKDFVETSLMAQIRDGNTAATIFYAKTKMRDRGYIETQVIATTDLDAFASKSDEELLEIINRKSVK